MSAGGETSLTSKVPIGLYNQVRHVPLNRSDCGSTPFQTHVLNNLNSLRHSVYRRSRLKKMNSSGNLKKGFHFYFHKTQNAYQSIISRDIVAPLVSLISSS